MEVIVSEDSVTSNLAVTTPAICPKTIEQAVSCLPAYTTEEARSCILRLARFRSASVSESFPKKRLAGVLVFLHINADGNLSLTLTTRALTMRSHPGETALPGGRYEESDKSVEETALREAYEEIGLSSASHASLVYLTTLPAFTSRNLLAVIPCVYLLTSEATPVLEKLAANPSEVEKIFHLPLKAFLGLDDRTTGLPKKRRKTGNLNTQDDSNIGNLPQTCSSGGFLLHSYQDFVWLNKTRYRLHVFQHANFPDVTGLTADILISTALIAFYGDDDDEMKKSEQSAKSEKLGGRRKTSRDDRLGFSRWAAGQMTWKDLVETAMSITGRQIVDRNPVSCETGVA